MGFHIIVFGEMFWPNIDPFCGWNIHEYFIGWFLCLIRRSTTTSFYGYINYAKKNLWKSVDSVKAICIYDDYDDLWWVLGLEIEKISPDCLIADVNLTFNTEADDAPWRCVFIFAFRFEMIRKSYEMEIIVKFWGGL